MTLKLKNYQLKPVGDLLKTFSLKPVESRMRSRFISILDSRLQLIAKEQEQLEYLYSVKGEDGEPLKQLTTDNKEYITLTDTEAYKRDSRALMDEDYHIESTEENKKIFKSVLESLLNTDREFADFEAQVYDMICSKLEDLNLD